MRDLVRPDAESDTDNFAHGEEEDTYRRFAAVLRRPRSSRRGHERVRGGRYGHKRAVEAFIQEKLGQDFTADGRVRFRLGRDNLQRLMIPGSIFHLRRSRDGGFFTGGNDGAMYWMERRPPTEASSWRSWFKQAGGSGTFCSMKIRLRIWRGTSQYLRMMIPFCCFLHQRTPFFSFYTLKTLPLPRCASFPPKSAVALMCSLLLL